MTSKCEVPQQPERGVVARSHTPGPSLSGRRLSTFLDTPDLDHYSGYMASELSAARNDVTVVVALEAEDPIDRLRALGDPDLTAARLGERPTVVAQTCTTVS